MGKMFVPLRAYLTNTWCIPSHIHLLWSQAQGRSLFFLVSEVGHVETAVTSSGKPAEFTQAIPLERQQQGPFVGRWADRVR